MPCLGHHIIRSKVPLNIAVHHCNVLYITQRDITKAPLPETLAQFPQGSDRYTHSNVTRGADDNLDLSVDGSGSAGPRFLSSSTQSSKTRHPKQPWFINESTERALNITSTPQVNMHKTYVSSLPPCDTCDKIPGSAPESITLPAMPSASTPGSPTDLSYPPTRLFPVQGGTVSPAENSTISAGISLYLGRKSPTRRYSAKPFAAPTISSKEHPKSLGQNPPAIKRETWQVQKDALSSKFSSTGWAPRKRLSPDALEGIKALHAQFPDRFTTPVLANQFRVSPEAIRRILKSKWKPNAEEVTNRRQRWDKRGERIWSKMVALGVKPPKKWREVGTQPL